jgi:hypothetical protein
MCMPPPYQQLCLPPPRSQYPSLMDVYGEVKNEPAGGFTYLGDILGNKTHMVQVLRARTTIGPPRCGAVGNTWQIDWSIAGKSLGAAQKLLGAPPPASQVLR